MLTQSGEEILIHWELRLRGCFSDRTIACRFSRLLGFGHLFHFGHLLNSVHLLSFGYFFRFSLHRLFKCFRVPALLVRGRIINIFPLLSAVLVLEFFDYFIRHDGFRVMVKTVSQAIDPFLTESYIRSGGTSHGEAFAT